MLMDTIDESGLSDLVTVFELVSAAETGGMSELVEKAVESAAHKVLEKFVCSGAKAECSTHGH